jgi:hypothetical protein
VDRKILGNLGSYVYTLLKLGDFNLNIVYILITGFKDVFGISWMRIQRTSHIQFMVGFQQDEFVLRSFLLPPDIKYPRL